ncbi:hypothetical protein L484_007223 [Morus notabilis]|uniref:Uncharacterized protein n=1 Tax=Morus notabilis TaxID=981085 RepID=W9QTQ7_9ROSA|nr:hypothetical protein L484_007223 [Morus notabilis]
MALYPPHPYSVPVPLSGVNVGTDIPFLLSIAFDVVEECWDLWYFACRYPNAVRVLWRPMCRRGGGTVERFQSLIRKGRSPTDGSASGGASPCLMPPPTPTLHRLLRCRHC